MQMLCYGAISHTQKKLLFCRRILNPGQYILLISFYWFDPTLFSEAVVSGDLKVTKDDDPQTPGEGGVRMESKKPVDRTLINHDAFKSPPAPPPHMLQVGPLKLIFWYPFWLFCRFSFSPRRTRKSSRDYAPQNTRLPLLWENNL